MSRVRVEAGKLATVLLLLGIVLSPSVPAASAQVNEAVDTLLISVQGKILKLYQQQE